MASLQEQLDQVAHQLDNWMGLSSKDSFIKAAQQEDPEFINAQLFTIEGIANNLRKLLNPEMNISTTRVGDVAMQIEHTKSEIRIRPGPVPPLTQD